MVDRASAGEQCEDFRRETLELSKDLERMTEKMENISVKLTWMAYDMVVLRTDPQLAKSLKRLENEFVQCKDVVCGSSDSLVNQRKVANQKDDPRKEKIEMSTDIALTATTVDLDYILMQLDTISEILDQLEVKTQLLQCDLTVCFTHPDKVACLQSGVEDSAELTASPELAK